MVPIKGRSRGVPTKHKGVRRLSKGKYLLRKTWVDPKTGRKTQKHEVFIGTLEDAAARRALLRPGPSVKKPTKPRFRQFALDWLKTHSSTIEASTDERYTREVAHLNVEFGDWWIDAITYKDLRDWQARMVASFAEPTVNGMHRTLRLILEEALAEGHVHVNLARKLSTLREKRTRGPRGTSMSAERFNAFVLKAHELGTIGAKFDKERRDAWANGKRGPRGYGDGIAPDIARSVIVCSWLGARLGEVVALRFSDIEDGEINIERSVWAGKEKTDKTDDPRRVTVVPALARAIDEQRRWLLEVQHPGLESGLIFPASPQQAAAGQARRKDTELRWYRSQSTIQAAVNTICKRAEIPRVTPHALRRTLEDLARQAGVEDLVRRAVQGWRTQRAQNIYATVSREERDEASAKVVDFLERKGQK